MSTCVEPKTESQTIRAEKHIYQFERIASINAIQQGSNFTTPRTKTQRNKLNIEVNCVQLQKSLHKTVVST